MNWQQLLFPANSSSEIPLNWQHFDFPANSILKNNLNWQTTKLAQLIQPQNKKISAQSDADFQFLFNYIEV